MTRDPELRTTNTGKDVCNFTVAVNSRQKKADGSTDVDFFRVTAWNNLAKSCKEFLAKGKKVCVVGTVGVSTFTGNDGSTKAQMEVTADDVEFLTPKGESGQAPAQEPAVATSAPAGATPVNVDDELPF